MFSTKKESLITKRKVAPKAEPKKALGPGQLTLFSLLCIFVVGAVATGLGLWHVQRHFEIRDYEIETARLQSILKVRANEVKKMDAKIATLTRYEDLLSAAKGPLGLVDPQPGVVSGIDVSTNRAELFTEAEKKAKASLARQLDLYTSRIEMEGGTFFPMN
ncbi:MAG: hypothetical protein ACFCU1_10725 [Sumerlaeia bacterium]